ncbi:MAG: hypothetical protein ACLQVG_31615, partial [Terriglobia bacterium]
APDTWHLTPKTCPYLFSSTSPDEPLFSMNCDARLRSICPESLQQGWAAFGSQKVTPRLTPST